MTFKDVMRKVRLIALCGKKDKRKPSLEISSPTDVRRMDVCEGMPPLSEFDQQQIGEKATDAYRLLSLQSHPPTQPHTPSPSNTPSSSNPPSRSPSHPLLGAPSGDPPPSLPTPPRQKHVDGSSPPALMKTMWERTRRLSTGLTSLNSRSSAGAYYELDTGISKPIRNTNTNEESNPNENAVGEDLEDQTPVVMLNLHFDDKLKGRGSRDGSLSTGSRGSEGFQVQDTVGGTPKKSSRQAASKTAAEIGDRELDDSSDSEVDAAVERKPLVVA